MPDVALDSFTTFGELLRHLRLRAHLTQDEFGLAVGYSRAHVARLENGQRLPDVAAVSARFVEALHLQDAPALAARLIQLAAAAHAQLSADPSAEPAQHPPNNPYRAVSLPVPLTSFIGRERELADLKHLLPSTRLLTLTGAGGVGKTRLALQLAGEILDAYPDGVWLVELAPLSDSGLALQAIAAVLGVHEQPGRPLLAILVDHLRDQHLLLLLDNCEHLIDAVARLADTLLRDCQDLHLLATSRESLGITGEVAWRVPSLRTPDPSEQVPLADLALYEALRLFDDRATLVQPAFALTAANAPAVRHICSQLDGIPLAIELAAARVKVLSVADIATRLDDRFRLLTGGSRTALPRQQTLRGAIDWSYDLLSQAERALFRRLAVFAGGWTLEAAEAVCAGSGIEAVDVLDLLTRLVNQSLVVVSEAHSAMRYHLLETLRQYALDVLRLTDAGEVPRARDRHIDYFIKLGEAPPQFFGSVPVDDVNLVNHLALDLDNVRCALDWAAETGRIDDGLRLAEAFSLPYLLRPRNLEQLTRLQRLVEHPAAPKSARVARAYLAISTLYFDQGERAQAEAANETARALGLALDDADILANADHWLAIGAQERGDYALARAYFEQWRALVVARHVLDDSARKEEEAYFNGRQGLYEGNYPQAQSYFAQLYASHAGSGHKGATSADARLLGYALIYQGEYAEATSKLRESLVDNWALGDKRAVAACLGAYGALALARAELPAAARLFGASEAICESLHIMLQNWDREQVRRNVAALRERLDKATLNAEWAAGRTMTFEQAVEYALATAPGSA